MAIVLHAATFNQSGCTGATASASVFAILLTLCVAAFITIILIISIKMKKQAHIIEMATQRRRRTTVPRYDEVDCQTSRGVRVSNYTYDEVDCQPPKAETVISTNKNIAYFNSTTLGQADANERVYAQI